MKSKYIGGILLIVGTSIGAGMLALPVANAVMGFWLSTLMLILCWALMALGALYMTEVSLYLPRGSHLLSMANETLGKPGLLLAWVAYILLLYTLLSAYISGGADVLGNLAVGFGVPLPDWLSITVFTLIFGVVVYQGIRSVDLLNRALMFGKLLIYVVLIMLIMPHVDTWLWHQGQLTYMSRVTMILITSFGFAIIVPNLRDYFHGDGRMLIQVVMIGSFIPLLCYIVWDGIILGTIPAQGEHGLMPLMHSDHTTSALAQLLNQVIQRPLTHLLFNFFTSICMLTAFLGVSLSLMSFFADGFKLTAKGREGFGLFLLTFLPPWVVVIYYPGAYIYALSYAGICCVVLLLLLPALMVYCGREKFKPKWQVPGGKALQIGVMLVSIGLLIDACFQAFLG